MSFDILEKITEFEQWILCGTRVVVAVMCSCFTILRIHHVSMKSAEHVVQSWKGINVIEQCFQDASLGIDVVSRVL